MSDEVNVVPGATADNGAMRMVMWKVGADCKSVTPTAPQDGGVQGEDNATEVVFDLSGASRLRGHLTYYIECITSMGEYDKTEPIAPDEDNIIRAEVPLAWTQHGGVISLRLVCQQDGRTLYTLEGKLRFAGRRTASKRVDTLLRTHIQKALDEVNATAEKAGEDAAAAAEAAETATAMARCVEEDAAAAAESSGVASGAAEQAKQASVTAANSANEAAAMADLALQACPTINESGSSVVCYPVAGSLLTVTAADVNLLTPTNVAGGNGISVTANGDGSYTLEGTAAADVSLGFCVTAQQALTVGDTLRLSGCPDAAGYQLIAEGFSSYFYDNGDGVEFPLPEDMLTFGIFATLLIAQGTVCDGVVVHPRLIRTADETTRITHRAGDVTQTYLLGADRRVTVTAAAGCNEILADRGTVTVSGQADPSHVWQDVEVALNVILDIQRELVGGGGV